MKGSKRMVPLLEVRASLLTILNSWIRQGELGVYKKRGMCLSGEPGEGRGTDYEDMVGARKE